MICDKCGTVLQEGSLFCTRCGQKLTTMSAAPESEATQVLGVDDPLLQTIWIEEERNGNEDAWDEKTAWSGNPAYAAARREPAREQGFFQEPMPVWSGTAPAAPAAQSGERKFCFSCGAPLKQGLRFCTSCGVALSPAAPVPRKAETTTGKYAEPSRKKGGAGAVLIVVGVVLLLAVIAVAAVLLLTGGSDSETLAHDLLGIYLWDKDPDRLVALSAPFDDEDLEDAMLEEYEDTLDQLSSAGFRLQASEVEDLQTYSDGDEYDLYQWYLEEEYGFDGDVEEFYEYEIAIEYDCTFYHADDAAVLVTLAEIDGEWVLVSFDMSEILSELAQYTAVLPSE